jgi:hypothetical protein
MKKRKSYNKERAIKRRRIRRREHSLIAHRSVVWPKEVLTTIVVYYHWFSACKAFIHYTDKRIATCGLDSLIITIKKYMST